MKVLSPQTDVVVTETHPAYKSNPKYNKNFNKVLNFKLSRAQHFLEVLGQTPYSKMWKVAIVRNPWDRYVSNWKWLTRKESAYPKKGWKARGWEGEDGNVSFSSFVKQMSWCYEDQTTMHGYQHDKWHIRNQIEHIIDYSGNIIVDHVGRFEDLDKEFKLICDKVEVSLELPHLNRVGYYSGEKMEHEPVKIHYSEYYDQELVDIIANRCKKDIDTFQYDYEEKK